MLSYPHLYPVYDYNTNYYVKIYIDVYDKHIILDI